LSRFEINPDDRSILSQAFRRDRSGCATRATFLTDVSGDDEAKKCQAQAKIETSGYSGAGMANARHLAQDSLASVRSRGRSEKREGIAHRRRERISRLDRNVQLARHYRYHACAALASPFLEF